MVSRAARVLNVASAEQIRRKQSAGQIGMAFFSTYGAARWLKLVSFGKLQV